MFFGLFYPVNVGRDRFSRDDSGPKNIEYHCILMYLKKIKQNQTNCETTCEGFFRIFFFHVSVRFSFLRTRYTRHGDRVRRYRISVGGRPQSLPPNARARTRTRCRDKTVNRPRRRDRRRRRRRLLLLPRWRRRPFCWPDCAHAGKRLVGFSLPARSQFRSCARFVASSVSSSRASVPSSSSSFFSRRTVRKRFSSGYRFVFFIPP